MFLPLQECLWIHSSAMRFCVSGTIQWLGRMVRGLFPGVGEIGSRWRRNVEVGRGVASGVAWRDRGVGLAQGRGVVQFRVGITLDFRGDVATSPPYYLAIPCLVFCPFLPQSTFICECMCVWVSTLTFTERISKLRVSTRIC